MATISGTGGNDTLNGTNDGDAIGGDAGADSIEGNGGNDSIGGGSGNDTIRGGAGADGIGGDDGNDSISGGDGDDGIGGGAGNDTIEGDGGNDGIGGDAGADSISGGAGNDTIGGGTENDTVYGDDGNDELYGDDGNDMLYGGDGDDVVDGGTGDDVVVGDAGSDTLLGGSGNDSLGGGDGGDSIDGGTGADVIWADSVWLRLTDHASAGGAATTLTVVNSSEETIGLYWIDGSGVDTFYASIPPGGSITQSTFEGHNWVIRGQNGNFRQLIEGAPNQTVNYGEFGFDDTVDGGDDNDAIYGELGDDIISGGTGSDTVDGGVGDDTIDGGDGNDDIQGGAGADSISGDAGFDYIDGGDGDDSISGGADDDTVIGGAGDDTVFGGDGNDTVSGNSGDDALHGDAGQDSLYGGSGEDYFDGGAGDDSLYMGDTSGFDSVDPSDGLRDVVRLHAGSGNDTAFDFDMVNDYIFIGSADRADIVLTQISPSQWVVTLPGGAPGDSLTINFLSGSEPANEDELRLRLIDDTRYTPPANGQPAQWNLACFTPNARIATPQGLRKIGSMRRGDFIMTADAGPQPLLEILCAQYDAVTVTQTAALRPVIIDAGAFGPNLPHKRMTVSRQHCFAASGGHRLSRALHLSEVLPKVWIQQNRPNPVKYIHLVLRHHHLVQVEGVWTETFFHNPVAQHDLFKGQHAAKNIVHTMRCRPLLNRADLRTTKLPLTTIGQLAPASPFQSDPSTRPETATASAPEGVMP